MRREESKTKNARCCPSAWLICAGQAGQPTWQGVAAVETIDQKAGYPDPTKKKKKKKKKEGKKRKKEGKDLPPPV
jgi:hypothetical protein